MTGGTTLVPGPRNALTDVAGLLVGQASDATAKTGVSLVTAKAPFSAAVHVMGGAPGTRETDLLDPDRLVGQVDALVLSGGSAFGLDAASGVVAALRASGRGFPAAGHRVPIVPAAILFDLAGGGVLDDPAALYPALGRRAWEAACDRVETGSVGAGTGATAGPVKGGIGTASAVWGGITVGALVAVNAAGSPCIGEGPHFWAAPHEIGGELGGLGLPDRFPPPQAPALPLQPGQATTIAIVATDAALDPAQLKRLAVTAHDGMARALVPSHSLIDGDLVFAASTGAVPVADPVATGFALGHVAATCLARAIARGVHDATPSPGDAQPCWSARLG